jgi:hypothetical protein
MTKIRSKKEIICFDIDNVICRTKSNYYSKSLPNINSINKINELYKKGYQIKIFTSRFMGRSKENIKLARKKGLRLTKKQLKIWGVKYHKLIFGKPSYDLFIDDKAIFFKKNWYKKINNFLKVKY